MKKQKCKECSKVIEGYTIEHVAFLMEQHMQKHKSRAKAEDTTSADASILLNPKQEDQTNGKPNPNRSRRD